MPRNLKRRVEVLFPVQDEKIRVKLYDMLSDYFRDNCQASELDSDGKWTQLTPPKGEKPFRVQKQMLERAARANDIPGPAKMEYTVRRSPPSISN
jgi:polyphosphate kinase